MNAYTDGGAAVEARNPFTERELVEDVAEEIREAAAVIPDAPLVRGGAADKLVERIVRRLAAQRALKDFRPVGEA